MRAENKQNNDSHRFEFIPFHIPNAQISGGTSSAEAGCSAVEYDYCPECRGRFSFNKPVNGVCPWCGHHLPNASTHIFERSENNVKAIVREVL